MSGTQRLPGSLGAQHLYNPDKPALAVLGSGCAGGTAPVFSIAISVTMNTPRGYAATGAAAGRAFNSSSATNALRLRPAEIASTPMPM